MNPSGNWFSVNHVASMLIADVPEGGSFNVAKAQFIRRVLESDNLVRQLFTTEEIRARAESYFIDKAEELRPPKGAGGGLARSADIGPKIGAAPETISSGEGHSANAEPGQSRRADAAADPINTEGQYTRAETGQRSLADGVDPKPSEGANRNEPTGPGRVAPSARPQSLGSIRGAAVAAKAIARTVLDSYKVRDGRCIGDVRMVEVERMRASNAMEASILRQIQRSGVPHTPDMLVREVIKPEQLDRFIQRAAEVADAA